MAGSFVYSRLQLYRRELNQLRPRERAAYLGRKLRTVLRKMSGRGSLEGVRLEMNLMKVYRANVAALARFERKPISARVKVLAVFETPQRAKIRGNFDWGHGSATQLVKIVVAGQDSGTMLQGENARVLAARLAEQLKEAFSQR